VATDPVCGMRVQERASSLRLVRDNRTYYFCSETCLHQFAEPDRSQGRLGRRLLVAWPLAVSVVVLTYGLGTTAAIVAGAVLAAIVQFYAGAPFYAGARDAVRDRSWNMDLLIAVGSTTAFVYSAFALALPDRLAHDYYFDASALIVTLILTGNYLEHRTRGRAGSALRRLQELLPAGASLLRDGREVWVPATEVRAGDRLRVRPGARFPTDGVVRAGSSSADEAILTGEGMPVPKRPGDPVLAGATNLEGPLAVEATSIGADTFVAQVGRLLTDAEMSRVPLQRAADRIASVFVPLVLALGAVAGIAWGLLGGAGLTVGVLVFVSVVITACPCAFGIATPAAIVVGTGRAAEAGVLFRGEESIERAARIDYVVTDKTGTLTRGRPSLTDVRPLGGISAEEAVALAAAVEAGSEHPFARAVEEAAQAHALTVPLALDLRAQPGRGVTGTVGGAVVEVVRATPGASVRPVDPDPAAAIARELADAGRSCSVVRRGGAAVAVLGFADELAPGAREAVRALAADGIPVAIATGDQAPAARAVAARLGITDVHAGLLPAEKLALIHRLQAQGRHVAYVGDGINDAPALASADLGIAIGSGTDVAREAGGVLLVRADLGGVPRALRLARRIVRKVRANIAWAVAYNAVLLPIAAGALVPLFGLGIYAVLPIAGAIAMALSSTSVVVNSLSLRWTPLVSPGGRPAAQVL